MTVCLASTLASYKVNSVSDTAWLTNAKEWQARGDVEIFAALQYGHGHDAKFEPLEDALNELGATIWRFSIDEGATEVTTGNRLVGITTGRNLAHEWVNRNQHISHLLFLDSDVMVGPEVLDQLLAVDHPIVGGNIPEYCLDGPKVEVGRVNRTGNRKVDWARYEWTDTGRKCHGGKRPFPRDADVREHWCSAGCWLLTRDAVNALRWGWHMDAGLDDDPWTSQLAVKLGLGQIWTRHDVQIRHLEPLAAMEDRGHDRSIVA